MPPGKHGPCGFDHYFSIHEKVLESHKSSGFIVSDDLEFADLGNGVVTIEGRIECADGLYIDVAKELRIVDDAGGAARIQTFAYSYNATLGGVGNVFRYCSAHPDHNQDHHVHRFNTLAGDRKGSVTLHGEAGWPTLGEVIKELETWWLANRANFP